MQRESAEPQPDKRVFAVELMSVVHPSAHEEPLPLRVEAGQVAMIGLARVLRFLPAYLTGRADVAIAAVTQHDDVGSTQVRGRTAVGGAVLAALAVGVGAAGKVLQQHGGVRHGTLPLAAVQTLGQL